MKKLIYSIIMGFVFIFISIAQANVPSTIQSEMHTMLKKAMPAVVNIVNQGEFSLIKDPFLKRELERMYRKKLPHSQHFASIGSGVIINAKKGIIVTNAHVVDQSKSITVTLNDGRRYQAKKIGVDDLTDIAVIQIKAKHLTALAFANSNQVKVGDFVAAIGSPFGFKSNRNFWNC